MVRSKVGLPEAPLTARGDLRYIALMPAATEQNTIVIEGVSWETYLQMDELLDDAPVRIKWADDRLEIMSPISRHHELIKSNIGRMIEAFCRRRGHFFQITGSATMRKERQRGGEPDDS